MFDRCPGSGPLRTPSIKLKTCPRCGERVEMLSNELQTSCPGCGLTVYDDPTSCVRWCQWAEQCVGPELYRKLTHQTGKCPTASDNDNPVNQVTKNVPGETV